MTPTSIIPAPNLFPSANVVYVDNDYKKLRSKGLLAYGNLSDAIDSWNIGGKANAKYGTPSLLNQATILLGAGTIQMLPAGLPQDTTFDANVEFLNIIGQGIDATTLVTNNSFSANVAAFRCAITNFSISHLTINTDHLGYNSGGIGFISAVESNAIIDSVKFYSRNNSYSAPAIFWNIPFNGTIKNCIFDASLTSNYTINMSASFNGLIDSCIFTVHSNMNNGIRFIGGAADSAGNISNCNFSGAPNSSFITITDANYIGEINNCYFVSTRSGCVGIQSLEVSAANPSNPFITDCTFEMCGPCISGQFGINTRIMDCYMRTELGNQSCLYMSPSFFGEAGSVSIFGSRLIGAGTGLSVFSEVTGVSNSVIVGNYLRMPNGDVPGTSISNNINNVATNPYNIELPANITI